MRLFLALCRLFVWGVSLALVLMSVAAFFLEIERKDDPPAKGSYALQAVVWILSAYFLARTFDLFSRNLEDFYSRLRRRRRR